jgi:hypothetical protein
MQRGWKRWSILAELHIVHAWHAIAESAMRGAFMRRPEDEIIAYVEQVRQQHATSLDGLVQARQLAFHCMQVLRPKPGSARNWNDCVGMLPTRLYPKNGCH